MTSLSNSPFTDPAEPSLSLPSSPQRIDDRPLQALFEGAIDAMLIADDAGRYINANAAACDLLGLPRAQLLGKQIRDFSAQTEDFDQAWQQFLTQGQVRGEFQIVRADGTTRTVEYAATAHVLPHQHLSILRDISDRKRAEAEILQLNQELEQRVQERTQALEATNTRLRQEIAERQQTEMRLRQSEQRLKLVLERMPMGCVMNEPDFRVSYWNTSAERIFGYSSKEVLGKLPYESFIPAAAKPYVQDLQHRMRQGDMNAHGINENLTKDGRTIICEWYNTPLIDYNGQFLGYFTIVQDITDRKRLEDSLHQSEHWLTQFSRHAPAIIYTLVQAADGHLWFEYVSEAVETIHEVSVQVLRQNPLLIITQIIPEDRPGYLKAVEHSRQHLSPFLYEWRSIAPSGQLKWLRAASQPEQRADGAIAWHGVVQDITHEKQLELALHDSEKQLRAIFENAELGIAMCSGVTAKLTLSNACFQQMLGYTAEELLQLQFTDFTHPDDIPAEIALIQECIAELRDSYQLEKRFICKDQTIRWVSLTASVLRDEAGQIQLGLAFAKDIGDRKQVEQELRKRDEMLRKLSEQIPGVIYQFRFDVDGHTCFPYASEAIRQIYGVTPAEVQQTAAPVFAMLHPDDLARIKTSIQQSYATLKIWHEEYRVTLPEIGTRWVEGHSRPEKLADGSVLWHGYIWDVTERKQIEQEIQQKSEREQLFITITQHIRQTLDLDIILNTTVHEVLNVLGCDRVLVYQLQPDDTSGIKAEALVPGCPSLGHAAYYTNCHACDRPCPFERRLFPVSDLDWTQAEDCPISGLLGQTAQAQLIVPILHQQSFWGLLVAHQYDQPRQWQPWEVDLLMAIADQVSIAIHQSDLFQQIQAFNLSLEQQIQERTAQLQQSLLFEALLKRITDRVRDSLDEDQILQAAVQELAAGLEVACCDAALYSEDYTVCTITHESTRTLAPTQGASFKITEVAIHLQLMKSESVYACLMEHDPIRPDASFYTILACPLLDNERVLGNLWLFKPKGDTFNDLETRLVQQVANQCAIALRQSRLYQAAQAQVRELERLNQLKDDFLNTVSHELRTPMSNIKMATQMLEIILHDTGTLASNHTSTDAQADRAAQYFQILNHECNRETALINDLLDLSRLEADADPMLWATIRLQDWILAIAEPFEQKIYHQNQQLQCEVAADLPPVTTDLQYLERILTELLQNACKYTPPGEVIAIAVAKTPHPPAPPATIQIMVRNTGVEIPPRELAHVFDKFYRVPRACHQLTINPR
ncbi:MAG: PAS domain S-box protein [Leptolyngbyaceae cyanobacterium bins.349]|nr:PAS domain S-box protein [Leptolyngbyaceae cyanobacterium bins.349]